MFVHIMPAVQSAKNRVRKTCWLPGVSHSVYQSFAHLHTLFSVVTSCTFPITPFTILQILPISNEISVVCNAYLHLFLCPHRTCYKIKPVLCKHVCATDQCELSLNMQLGAVFTRTQQCMQPAGFTQTRLVWMISYIFQIRDSVVHIREHSDMNESTCLVCSSSIYFIFRLVRCMR